MDKRELYAEKKAPIAAERGHVCVCRGVAKETIVEAIKCGSNTFEALKVATTAGTGCSLCEPIIEDIISAS